MMGGWAADMSVIYLVHADDTHPVIAVLIHCIILSSDVDQQKAALANLVQWSLC